MNGGGGCSGAHALPPQGAGPRPAAAAAAADTNDDSSNLVISKTRKTKRPPITMDETREQAKKKQRHHHHLQVLELLGQKRKYEYVYDSESVEVGCRENDKMFKCNYWEDPAYAKRLQRDGLQRARIAAQDNQIERLLMPHTEFDEPVDAPHHQQQPPEPAGASNPPIVLRPEVPDCADRYRRFYHDYC